MKKVNVLAELLKCALFDEVIEESVKKTISENSRVVYNMALRHDLAHLMEHAVGKSKISICDKEISNNLLKQKAMSVMRYEDLDFAQKRVCELFENEKIPFILLKGAVIRGYYPEPWMRTSCDVDILVRKEDILRAERAVIEKLGYTGRKKQGYHDVSLFSDTGVHLELHFSIKENIETIDSLLEKVWDYAAPLNESTYEHVLDNAFFMFHTLAHMSYHFVDGGCGIRSFVDLFILENKLSFDRNKFSGMLESTGLEKFYEACVKYANVWFTEREHDEMTRLMHKYLLEGGVYGSKEKSIALKTAYKGKVRYFFERIFMPYKQLIISYPDLKKKPYLTPFYQVKRWVRVVRENNLSRSAKELSQSASFTKQQTEDVLKLMKILRL